MWPFAFPRLTVHFASGLVSDLVICESKDVRVEGSMMYMTPNVLRKCVVKQY